MRKLMYFMFAVNLIFTLGCSIWTFSFDNDIRIAADKTTISIEKPKEMSNAEYIPLLEDAAKNLGTDFCYVTYEFPNDKYVETVYTTGDYENFLNLSLEDGKFHIYSTMDLKGAGKIYGCRLFMECSVYPLSSLEQLSMEKLNFYVAEDKVDDIIFTLQKENVEAARLGTGGTEKNYKSSMDMLDLIGFLLLLFLFIAVLFYMIQKTKEITLLKLNGSSFLEILRLELRDDIRWLGCIFFTGAVCTLLGVILLWGAKTGYLYVCSAWKRLLFFLAFSAAVYFLSLSYTFCRCSLAGLKGKTRDRQLFLILTAARMLIIIVLVTNTSGTVAAVKTLNQLNDGNLSINNEIQNYVYTTMQDPNGRLFEREVEREFREGCIAFVEETEEAMHGVILDTTKYALQKDYKENNGDCRDITINGNYLDINPIYDPDGNRITKERFVSNKLNLILSEDEDREVAVTDAVRYINEIEKAYFSDLRLTKDDVNVIIYSNTSKIYALNPYTSGRYTGLLEMPIMYVLDTAYYAFREMEIPFSNGAYLLKCKTDNPASELTPYFKKYEIDEFIMDTPYIRNAFSDEISNTSISLLTNLGVSVLYLVPMLLLLVYLAMLYCTNHSREIFIKRINGMGTLRCHWRMCSLEFFQWAAVSVALLYRHMDLGLLVLLVPVNFIVLQAGICYFEGKNIHAILKGWKE